MAAAENVGTKKGPWAKFMHWYESYKGKKRSKHRVFSRCIRSYHRCIVQDTTLAGSKYGAYDWYVYRIIPVPDRYIG